MRPRRASKFDLDWGHRFQRGGKRAGSKKMQGYKKAGREKTKRRGGHWLGTDRGLKGRRRAPGRDQKPGKKDSRKNATAYKMEGTFWGGRIEHTNSVRGAGRRGREKRARGGG